MTFIQLGESEGFISIINVNRLIGTRNRIIDSRGVRAHVIGTSTVLMECVYYFLLMQCNL